MSRVLIAVVIALVLAGCAEVPDFSGTVTEKDIVVRHGYHGYVRYNVAIRAGKKTYVATGRDIYYSVDIGDVVTLTDWSHNTERYRRCEVVR